MIPFSCSRFSAAIVEARTRARTSSASPGRSGLSAWTAMIIAKCSATASRPNGSVGFVDDASTDGTPASSSTSGVCPPPHPSTWYAWKTRPPATASVSCTDRPSLSPSVCTATCTSCSSATVRQVSSDRRCAPVSSCTLKPHTPAASASSIGACLDAEPRPSSPTFTGYASNAAYAARSGAAALTPTPQNGPNSCPIRVVTPEARAASITRGDSRWTWVSTAPAVAISPSPLITIDPVPTTTSMPAVVSGLPARPTAAIRPPRMPMLVVRTPRTGSRTSTLVTTASTDSWLVTARSAIPSRPVLAKPSRNSSRSGWSCASTSTTRPVSPSRTRSPVRGPYTVAALTAAPPGARPGDRASGRRPRPAPPPARCPCRRTRSGAAAPVRAPWRRAGRGRRPPAPRTR